ncbi:hypothetical protein MOUN0_N04500 [Monosporozyma unispora]
MNVKLFVICIVGWYFTSITLSVYNKWMFSPINGLGIEYPILLTAGHQLTLWFFSFIYILIRGRDKYNQIKKPDWNFYLKYMIPTAVATAGDIGLSNISFKFVPLTVYTIVKSSSIAFVLLFSCLFKLEKFRWKLGGIVGVMFIGVVLMVYKPNSNATDDHDVDQGTLIFGAFIVLGSACLSGLRWVYTQLILRKSSKKNELNGSEAERSNKDIENRQTTLQDEIKNEMNRTENSHIKPKKPHPIYTIYQLAPIMCITLIFTSIIVERPFPEFFHCNLFKSGLNSHGSVSMISIIHGIILMLIPGICVFILTLSEFGILQISKVLTLSIAGIIKEVLTILVGIVLLSERISGFYNILGMSIVLLDVCYYNYFRYREKQIKDKYISLREGDTDINSNDDETSFPMREPFPSSSGQDHIKNKTEIQDNDSLFFDDDEVDHMPPFPTAADMTIQEYEMDFLEHKFSSS